MSMSDQYTNKGDFRGTLVDDSLKKEYISSNYADNGPYQGDTTDEGGYGGDVFSRENQAPQQKGQFSRQDRPSAPPYQQQDKEDDDQDRYAGEGIIPPNQAAGAQAASSGVGAQSQFSQKALDGSNIGG
ncbi:hypothetical protein FRB95_011473 [Tulasnella sp. JGI-2019a]|nr:hypothetical protein FRB95_011473 [Tulasnella sp. JGI-2019a]